MSEQDESCLLYTAFFISKLLEERSMARMLYRRGWNLEGLEQLYMRLHVMGHPGCEHFKEEPRVEEKPKGEIPQWLQLSPETMQKLSEMDTD